MDLSKPMIEILNEMYPGGIIFKEVPNGIKKAIDYFYSVPIFEITNSDFIKNFNKACYDSLSSLAGKDNRKFQENYFNNFTPIWRGILGPLGNITLTEIFWLRILDPIYQWEEQNKPSRIHKGSPYYYLGVSFLNQNFVERGYLYCHKSYAEDKITEKENNPDSDNLPETPSYLLLTTNDENPNQFYLTWVQEQAKFIQQLIDDFNTLYSKSFDQEQLRSKFLGNTELIEEIYLFSYITARIKQIFSSVFIWDKLLFESNNALSLQILLSLCFDLTKIIEKLIAIKEIQINGLIDDTKKHRRYFSYRLSFLKNGKDCFSLDRVKIDKFNEERENASNLTIKNLLRDSFIFEDLSSANEIDKTYLLALGIRNHYAHNTEPLEILGDKHIEIFTRLYHLLFFVLDELY
ncbi:MAG: hypothetical protein CL609_23590 [Anaerolineaceae bacterium]|nr:hypothetical protein [Anaerolineaceae bacterium]